MDQQKNQGQQNQGQGGTTPNRDPAEGARQPKMPGDQHQGNPPRDTQERGKGSGAGISNRGMDSRTEQEDLPERGSRDSDFESDSER